MPEPDILRLIGIRNAFSSSQLDVAHHVEAVGNLDEHYPRILGVGYDQTLVVLGLQAGLLGFDSGYFVETLRYVYDFMGK